MKGKEKSNLIFYVLLLLSMVSGAMGFMKWMQAEISIPFFSYKDQYHIWMFVEPLHKISHFIKADEIRFLNIIVEAPLVLWGLGLFIVLVAVGMRIGRARISASKCCLMIANVLFLLSAGTFLVIVYGVRYYFKQMVHKQTGISIGRFFVGPTIFPWIMLFFSMAAVVAYICERVQNDRKGRESKVFEAKAEIKGNDEIVHEMLVLQERKNPENVYACYLDEPVVVGRAAYGCNIVIPDEPGISHQHCQFFLNQNKCFIRDLNSLNQTYVNETVVTTPMPLQVGDVVKLGQLELIVAACPGNDNPQAGGFLDRVGMCS